MAADVPVPTALAQGGGIESWPEKETVAFGYSEELAGDHAVQHLVLLAGVRVRLAPHFGVSAEKWQSLESTVTFAAEPALPEGLLLHPRTGAILGVPQVKGVPSWHTITACVPATCPGGISLGALPLTSCSIAIRIEDLNGFDLTWTEDATGHGKANQLAFKMQALQENSTA